MALDTIKPGSTVTVKIVKNPTNEAATKTLQRLLGKDPQQKKDATRLRRIRQQETQVHQRGGRQWRVNMPKPKRLEGRAGESGTIKATTDVLRDLRSVERFVDVQAA
jgi:hypothetical protein